ncbi:MAG: Hsp20/alpha crystallin family protein [Acidimicrobiia bacterium]
MAIARWTPFGTLAAWEHDMESMLDRFLGRDWFNGERLGWRPRVDMFRQKGDLIIRVELPGIDPNELDIQMEGEVLHIAGERTFDEEVTEEDRYMRERFYGRFERRLMLPEGTDADQLEATYTDGVLTMKVPLPAEVLPKARKIAVHTD